MNIWIGFLILLMVIVVVAVMSQKPPIPTEKLDNDKIGYRKKRLLSPSERKFLDTLKDLEKYTVIIPQVNLASVIQKTGDFKWQNELYRNIDFGIFDKEYNLLLLIELNDSSHAQSSRKRRDIKVKDICARANIKLLTFYTNKPNEKAYVLHRITEEIKAQPTPKTMVAPA